MSKKAKHPLRTIQIPRELAAKVYPIAEGRVQAFVYRYTTEQCHPQRHQADKAMTITDLARSAYLQGLWDGFLACSHNGHK